jgi:diguanylate cyclase (GGDEF)-like protein
VVRFLVVRVLLVRAQLGVTVSGASGVAPARRSRVDPPADHLDVAGEGLHLSTARADTEGETEPGPGGHVAVTGTRRLDGAAAIWALAAVQFVLAGVLFVVSVLPAAPLPDAPLRLPVWFLIAAFGLAEMGVVHIQLRRDAHTFSLSEFPLVLGLFFAAPWAVVVANLVGIGLELAFVRRQSPLKLLFNLAHFVLGAVVATAFFHAVIRFVADPTGPVGWLVALAAVAAASATSVLAIFVAMSLSEGRILTDRLRDIGTFAAIGTLANTSLAVVAVVVAWQDPRAALLLAAPTAAVYFAYRGYTSQRQRHETLEFLYESSRLLHESPEVESALTALLVQARETFRAGTAELVLAPTRPGDPALRIRVEGDDASTELEPVEFGESEAAVLARLGADGPQLIGPSRPPGDDLRVFLSAHAVDDDAMIAPLAGEERPLGLLLLGDRLGDVSYFDAQDLRLFATLTNHVSSSLEVGRLEKTLGQLTELKDELRHRAYHDALTGLANRSLFTEEVELALLEERNDIAVLFFDLDDFKTVNDSLGHQAGDDLLQAVSGRLQACLKSRDMPARMGGDEFAVLLRDLDAPERAQDVARRIIGALTPPFHLAADEVTTHCSIGIAYPDATVAGASELLRNADIAMYVAKRESKGSFRLFEESMHDEAQARLSLRTELQAAVEHDQFEVHLQPLVDLSSGMLVGAEALLRWDHPTKGLLTPGAFLELAEESGLLVPIGSLVLERACRAAAHWTEPLTLTVNIARSQLTRSDLVADVARALEASGLAPDRLLLEVTEYAVMQDIDRSHEILSRLVGLGVRVALDDFGTGYSSLEHLARLPVHLLKVAKTFVDGIGNQDRRAVVARGIVDLARALGLGTIAEGIETEVQAAQLRAWGCALGQGYLFGRPVPARDFPGGAGTVVTLDVAPPPGGATEAVGEVTEPR